MADVAAVEKKMDMSLDDIIKANRKNLKKNTGKAGTALAKGGKQRAPLRVDSKQGNAGKKVQAPKTVNIKLGVAGKRQTIKQKKQAKTTAATVAAGRATRVRAVTAAARAAGIAKAGVARGAALRRTVANKIVSRARGGKQAPIQVVAAPKQQKQQAGGAGQRRAKQQVQYTLAPAQPKQLRQQRQQQHVQGASRGAQVLSTNQRMRQQRANRNLQPMQTEMVPTVSRRQQQRMRRQQQEQTMVQHLPRQAAPMVIDDGYLLHNTMGGGVRKAARQQAVRNPVYVTQQPPMQPPMQQVGRGRRLGRGGAQIVMQPQQPQRVMIMPAPRMVQQQQQVLPRRGDAMAMQQGYMAVPVRSTTTAQQRQRAPRIVRPEPTLVRMGVSHGGMGGAPSPAALRQQMQRQQQGYRGQVAEVRMVQHRHMQAQPVMQQGRGYGGGRRIMGNAQAMEVDYY